MAMSPDSCIMLSAFLMHGGNNTNKVTNTSDVHYGRTISIGLTDATEKGPGALRREFVEVLPK